MQKYILPKLLGLAFLTMVILVIISFIEVAIYSYLITPGMDITYYDTHAELTAPYISGIFGFIIFFIIARYWKIKKYSNAFKLSILLPTIYLLMDVLILTVAGVVWADFILIFILANGAKFLGSFLGNKLTHAKNN